MLTVTLCAIVGSFYVSLVSLTLITGIITYRY